MGVHCSKKGVRVASTPPHSEILTAPSPELLPEETIKEPLSPSTDSMTENPFTDSSFEYKSPPRQSRTVWSSFKRNAGSSSPKRSRSLRVKKTHDVVTPDSLDVQPNKEVVTLDRLGDEVVDSSFRGSFRSSKRSGKFKRMSTKPGSPECSSPPPTGNGTRMESTVTLAKDVIQQLKQDTLCTEKVVEATQQLYRMVDDAWSTPKYGRDLAYSISDALRMEGGLDILLKNCKSDDRALQLNSARLLEQIMTANNRDFVVRKGLESVVKLACSRKEPTLLQIGMGILENLFKHSEDTCTKVIDRGGLQAVLYSCRMSDNITLRHCAAALANCAMYGGSANQQRMIEFRTSEWLFPLAFNSDNSIRYYACLAIAVLASNQAIERQVVSSGTLDLVEPFVTTHDPGEFARSDKAHSQGRSEGWLTRLVPLLECTRREAKCLAAFHFAMEAIIKKDQGRTKVFHDINVIGSLRQVASSNNEIASKLAIQALRTIGEEIPCKLSFNISCWSVKEVQMWVKTIGFASFGFGFENHKVDGDLLLTITETELMRDIEMESSLLRRRFLRELGQLKCNSNSGDKDLYDWLKSLGPEYPQYTHNLMHCGIDIQLLPFVTDIHLKDDGGITNGVHRMKILKAIHPWAFNPYSFPGSPAKMKNITGLDYYPKVFDSPQNEDKQLTDAGDAKNQPRKSLDVFISYRRATGSLLASLLKVHLQLRGFTVFIDVEKLEAGKFDNNLLNSVRSAKSFVMVLSSGSLDRCMGDRDHKDWVHREIVTALECKCNIVPVIDNFKWPKPDDLPEDMRGICFFNGIKWIHDYQDACIDKLERFLKGEENMEKYIDNEIMAVRQMMAGHGLRTSSGGSSVS
ncbi:sterile alpha and TIR motif-containing protein 1 isoform X2 [Strongylocentrotus purpuratus]|uniref:ADP-ribosyl cyclase/cyclic ADP-ribose hydrolase n=1 Tax=Strongylocentrotus purpuratus TaxID=7668 RepID=A0A7M7T1Y2_STRPU|nr:sterile alpha and TIR motif-containing protein 1 isoform X2 [Strongylocentrotus purpuratus]